MRIFLLKQNPFNHHYTTKQRVLGCQVEGVIGCRLQLCVVVTCLGQQPVSNLIDEIAILCLVTLSLQLVALVVWAIEGLNEKADGIHAHVRHFVFYAMIDD